MAHVNPPQYTTTPSETRTSVLLNLAPLSDHFTFQLGALGNGLASIQGEVQIKLTGTDDQEGEGLFSKLEVVFRGVERVEGAEEIELCEMRQLLWGIGVAGSSSESDTGGVPSHSTFKLDLTSDLPHCIHFSGSSLEYSLAAILSYADTTLPPLVKTVPIHLVRTSPPGSLLAGSSLVASADPPPSTAPQTFAQDDPIPFSVRLSRTVFRRSEPIELLVRIEVPSPTAVQRFQLRTVSAALVRKVVVGGVPLELETVEVDELEAVEEPGNGKATASEQFLEDVVSAPEHITTLAKSGKSARFSPTRPIVIRLLLHPPSTLSCESITQSTILHSISFEVHVTVSLISQDLVSSSRQDCTVSRVVYIVPDSPSVRSDKQREVDSSAEDTPDWVHAEGPVPTYSPVGIGESSGSGAGNLASTSQPELPSVLVCDREGREDEEYDGYEELSASLSTRAPPPTIDEDVSPPSVTEPSSLPSPTFIHPLSAPPSPAITSDPSTAAPQITLPFTLELSSLLLSPSPSPSPSSPPSSPYAESEPLPPRLVEEGLPPPYAGTPVITLTSLPPTGPPPYTSSSHHDVTV